MRTIEMLSIGEYLALEDNSEYNFILKYSNFFRDPIDWYNVGDVMNQPFGLIKDYQYDLINGITLSGQVEYFEKFTGKTTYHNEALYKIINTISYIDEGIEKILETEKQSLTPSPSESEIETDLFDGLGIYIQLRELADGDITKIESIKKLKYSDCFVELYTRKQINEYQKIVNERNKVRRKNINFETWITLD